MPKRLAEETILFISIVKWVVLATGVGALIGVLVTWFLKLLGWAIAAGESHPYAFLLLPLAMAASTLLVDGLAPDARGHGTEKVIEAIHKQGARIKPLVVPVKLAATVVTLAAGGSVGKEGPCAQIGAGIASVLAGILKFGEHDRRKLVICGISAGFALVFGTPIAGSIFGVEVLFVGGILYEVLLPSFIAGITAYHVSSLMGVTYFHHPVRVVPVFSEVFFLQVILAGLWFGMCSVIMIEVLRAGQSLAGQIRIRHPWKAMLGGAGVVGLALVFGTRYLGLGLTTIEACLNGHPVSWFAFLLKPVFTSMTLNFGGSGGIVTPIFFVGASSGTVFAHLAGLDPATFAAMGMAAVLAGAANTPIAASLLAMEMFGPALAPYTTVACVISFLMTGHRSVYPSQVLSVRKSESLRVELGREIEAIQASFAPRERGLTTRALVLLRALGRMLHLRGV